MRNILSLSVLAVLSTGGVALANPRGAIRDHRSAPIYSHERSGSLHGTGHAVVSPHGGGGHAPFYVQSHGAASIHSNGHAVAQPVHAYNGRFQFSTGVSYAAPQPPSGYYNSDYYSPPAPYVEDHHDVAGYTWIPGSWQWDGYQWAWAGGYYQPIVNNSASVSFGIGYGY